MDSEIVFEGGIFRSVSNMNLLVPVGSGELSMHPSKDYLTVRYRLRFSQMLIVVSVVALAVFVTMLMNAQNPSQRQDAVVVLFFVWLGLFGGNVAISIARFPPWIVRTVSGK